NGLETLAEIRRLGDASVIMVTGAGSETLVVEAMRAGAVDYLVKEPGFLDDLPLVVERAWRHHDLAVRAAELERLSLLVTSASTRAEILGGIVSGARRLLRADTCVLFLQRDGEVVAEATDGAPVQESGVLLAKAQAMLGAPEAALQDLGPRRHLLVPLRSEAAGSGSLALVTTAPREYLPAEIRLAETFTAFAAIALANLHRLELQGELVERLQGLNDLRRDMLTSVSHELRTPLTCIVGFGATLSERWEHLHDDQRRQMVRQINQHADELTDQVSRLLDVAALEAGRLSGAPGPVDLADEVHQAMSLLSPLVEGRRVEIAVPPIRAVADPVLLRRGLTNLVSNAVKYSPAGTPIVVRAAQREGFVQLDVVDRGGGLTPDEAHRAFEPFWRSASAIRGATRGAGVGLALVKEYARMMGGDAFATSRPGGGSVFSMTLPLEHAAEDPVARRA
ncbi:MAG: response regulator, partial [Nitriliruptorales bacterium]|nr:response regulator [Nitriliruptorales bacterium]